MTMAKKRITITELARELQTTPSTVSRALRGHSSISKQTIRKVKDLAKKRNYTVNRAASNLRIGKSKTLGVVVPRINRDFFAQCIAGIEEVASAKGFSTIICQTQNDLERERKSVYTLIESNVEGILISTDSETDQTDYFEAASQVGIPVIFFDRSTKNPNQNKVVIDDKSGSYKAVMHLLSQGYKRIAHFAGPQHVKIYRDRKKGYLKALKDRQIPIDENLIIHDVLKKNQGYDVIDRLMGLYSPPDAILSASDYSALGAVLRLKELGISIPQQVGIIGFSNEMFTNIVSPSMSTIDQHSHRIGHYAATACFDTIEEKNDVKSFKKIVIDPTLIIRESTNRMKKSNIE